MNALLAYCNRCNREVRLIATDAPLHDGQAPLADQEIICLECSDACAGVACSVTNLSHVVMEHRVKQIDKEI